MRILIDPGSEVTLISEEAVQRTKLERRHSTLPLIGIGGTHGGTARDLQLADPYFLKTRPVDLVLGADVYGLIIENGIRKGSRDCPIAQNSIFGWIVLGSVRSSTQLPGTVYQISVDHELESVQEFLMRFWEQEEVSPSEEHSLSPDEENCEIDFRETHSCDSSGRYIVRLPLKGKLSQLGNSYFKAERCLNRLLTRLSRDSVYAGLYSTFLKEYELLSHMKRVSSEHATCSPAYYLPHHGVFKEGSTTTRLRVVFNGSSPSSSGVSLNDLLLPGAKIQIDLSDVLLWVRRHRFVFSTDITKMFRQIRVHESDWDLQRILWLDNDQSMSPFHLTTDTYGTKSAPFLAVRVLLLLVEDEGANFPLAIPLLTKGRYVDDIIGGAESLTELQTQAHQLIGICTAGGFPLAKWQSYYRELTRLLSVDSNPSESYDFETKETKLLGLSWFTNEDVFKFTTEPSSPGTKITKRRILSEIAHLYDTLGFVSPIVIRAKILLQRLWQEKLDWDEPVPSTLAQSWTTFKTDLNHLSTLDVPRWLNLTSKAEIEIHGFSDASQLAMGTVVYLRVTEQGRGTSVSLVCSKTRVAPLKRITIPRLELTAALLLTKLVRYVQKTLELSNSPVFMWTDSSVTLTWINGHHSRWKEFVRNRVLSIQDLIPQAQWCFIQGTENPADCASRGLTVSQLERHKLWWNGPHWLAKSSHHWNTQLVGADSAAELKERPGLTFTITTDNPKQSWDLLYRFSSIKKLLRITAICFKVLAILKGEERRAQLHLSPEDLENSRRFWIKREQRERFSTELRILTNGQSLHQTHVLSRLTAFIDSQGVLRVGGRLRHSALQPESKHPAILPRDSQLSHLLIADAHLRTLHGGVQSTLAYLRTTLWIIGGRAPVRSFILRCVTCARHRGIRSQQLMGQLPLSRVTPSRPFLNTGVDYAGPVSIKTWRGRGAKIQKGWLCVFVCFSTSAVHLEAVTDYSTDGFLAAYRRLTARRGLSRTLISDCGTNFQGAERELKHLFTAGTRDAAHLAHLLSNDGTSWSFNPPAAPHMGGKWEAVVKSVKCHLRRTISETVLTYEELTTLLTQIEAVLNSRPLEPLTEDPDDLSALTPGHFLIGEPLTTIPEPNLTEVAQSRLPRWQLVQQRVQFFWNRWSSGYLQRQQSISKWHHPSIQIKVGSMVLLTDERMPPSKWPLARVTVTHEGKDGLTRVVTIKTATTTLIRPISKLAVLPVPTPE